MDYAERLGEDHFLIFLVHGVVKANPPGIRNYTRKHLELTYFEAFLDSLLNAGGQAMSMDNILDALTSGTRLPNRSFAITFDDGFLNNHRIAAPAMRARGIPCTFYVTTDFIDRNSMSWIDRIEYAINLVDCGTLDLPWGQRSFSRDERIDLLNEIRRNAKQPMDITQHELADRIQDQLGFYASSLDDALNAKMSWNHLRDLNSDPLFTIGGHTHTHPIMSFLDDSGLRREVDGALDLLRQNGVETHHFSYPEGLDYCYNAKVIDHLRKNGITICPTAIDGVNYRDAHPFHLRRIMVV